MTRAATTIAVQNIMQQENLWFIKDGPLQAGVIVVGT